MLGERTLSRWGGVSYHLPGPSCSVSQECIASTVSSVLCSSCSASVGFLMTFVTSGISLAGSRQSSIAPFHVSLSCIGEGNGNPLQCSCLENPGNRGAWWAAVYGVAQSRTRLSLGWEDPLEEEMATHSGILA